MAVINMDDFNVWMILMCGFRHVSNEPPCYDMLCPRLWKI
jgi:hypothetical protein